MNMSFKFAGKSFRRSQFHPLANSNEIKLVRHKSWLIKNTNPLVELRNKGKFGSIVLSIYLALFYA